MDATVNTNADVGNISARIVGPRVLMLIRALKILESSFYKAVEWDRSRYEVVCLSHEGFVTPEECRLIATFFKVPVGVLIAELHLDGTPMEAGEEQRLLPKFFTEEGDAGAGKHIVDAFRGISSKQESVTITDVAGWIAGAVKLDDSDACQRILEGRRWIAIPQFAALMRALQGLAGKRRKELPTPGQIIGPDWVWIRPWIQAHGFDIMLADRPPPAAPSAASMAARDGVPAHVPAYGERPAQALEPPKPTAQEPADTAGADGDGSDAERELNKRRSLVSVNLRGLFWSDKRPFPLSKLGRSMGRYPTFGYDLEKGKVYLTRELMTKLEGATGMPEGWFTQEHGAQAESSADPLPPPADPPDPPPADPASEPEEAGPPEEPPAEAEGAPEVRSGQSIVGGHPQEEEVEPPEDEAQTLLTIFESPRMSGRRSLGFEGACAPCIPTDGQ